MYLTCANSVDLTKVGRHIIRRVGSRSAKAGVQNGSSRLAGNGGCFNCELHEACGLHGYVIVPSVVRRYVHEVRATRHMPRHEVLGFFLGPLDPADSESEVGIRRSLTVFAIRLCEIRPNGLCSLWGGQVTVTYTCSSVH